MFRRTFLVAATLAISMPLAALAQANPLQSAFSELSAGAKRTAQEQLQAGGFYQGAIDGQYGQGTQSALINGAAFITENSYGQVKFNLNTPGEARKYVQYLASGDLGKYLFGEGDEADY